MMTLADLLTVLVRTRPILAVFVWRLVGDGRQVALLDESRKFREPAKIWWFAWWGGPGHTRIPGLGLRVRARVASRDSRARPSRFSSLPLCQRLHTIYGHMIGQSCCAAVLKLKSIVHFHCLLYRYRCMGYSISACNGGSEINTQSQGWPFQNCPSRCYQDLSGESRP